MFPLLKCKFSSKFNIGLRVEPYLTRFFPVYKWVIFPYQYIFTKANFTIQKANISMVGIRYT